MDAIARRQGVVFLFEKVAPLLRSADAVVANMEGCISTRGIRADKEYTFRAPPALASALASAGIRLVTLGNNHAVDFGRVALIDTLVHLWRARVWWVGAGTDSRRAGQAVTLRGQGCSVSVLGFTAIVPRGFAATERLAGVATLTHCLPVLARVRQEADVVIVVPHWGKENQPQPSPTQRRIARLLAKAGADLIVGHHPHVVQGYERIGRTQVLYSVGNFVHTPASSAARRGGILWAEVGREGVRTLSVTPLWLSGGRPTVAEPTHAQVVARAVAPLPVDW